MGEALVAWFRGRGGGIGGGAVFDIDKVRTSVLKAVERLDLFHLVEPAGPGVIPPVTAFPAASVRFGKAKSDKPSGRRSYNHVVEVLVQNKNVKSYAAVVVDTNPLINAVIAAIQDRQLGLDDIEPFGEADIEEVYYRDGEIAYLLSFTTRQYLYS